MRRNENGERERERECGSCCYEEDIRGRIDEVNRRWGISGVQVAQTEVSIILLTSLPSMDPTKK